MLLVLYLLFSLFMLHSALMSGSRGFAIFAILLFLIPVCLFVMLLVQRKLTRVYLNLSGDELVLEIEKRGLLPVSGIRYTVAFSYDQTGEGAVLKNSASSVRGRTEIVFTPDLPYIGSGVFELRKCTISDYAGFFRLNLLKRKHAQRIPVELMPEDREVLLDSTGAPGQTYFSEYQKTVQKPGDDASETFDIREYHAGDSISRLHWKLPAKRETPMIREFSREDNARFLFVLGLSERRQEHFHKVLSNYYSLAVSLPEEENGHVLLFEDPRGDYTELPVEDARELENALLTAFSSFQSTSYGEMDENPENALFSPHSASEILEDYHQRFGARRFIREFIVTDEELRVLAERWNEDEDF